MDRDLQREVVVLRKRLTQCCRHTRLAMKYRPGLILAVLGLHLLIRDINRTRDPAKHRTLIRKFDQGQVVIHRIIDRAHQESQPHSDRSQESRPDRRAA